MSRFCANALLLFACMIWGSTFVVHKAAFLPLMRGEEGIGPFAFAGFRFLLGALVVMPLAWNEAKKSQPLGRLTLWGCVLCGVLLSVGSVAQQTGLMGTSVTNAGFLTGVYVVLAPVFSLVVFRRRPHWMIWPTAVSCLAGIWFLSGGTVGALTAGDWQILFSTVFWAAHVVMVALVVQRSQRPLTLAFLQFVCVGVFCLVGAWLVESVSWHSLEAAWIPIVYSGIVSVGGGFTFQVIAQRYTHPAAAAVILSGEMVFAAIAGAIVFDERMSFVQQGGALLIVGSIVVMEVAPYVTVRFPLRGRKGGT